MAHVSLLGNAALWQVFVGEKSRRDGALAVVMMATQNTYSCSTRTLEAACACAVSVEMIVTTIRGEVISAMSSSGVTDRREPPDYI
jgi:hypothetical protein